MKISLGLALLVFAVSGVTEAQPGQAPGAPLPPPPPAPQGQPLPPADYSAPPLEDQGILGDANSGRVFVSPTALMQPAGTWTFNNYELFLLGGSYAFSDNFAMSATILPPYVEDVPLFFIINAKLGLLNRGRSRVAMQGSFFGFFDVNGDEFDDDTFGAGMLGGAFTYCTAADCSSYLNFFGGVGFSLEDDNSAVPLVFSAGFVQKLGSVIKLAIEIDSGAAVGDINETAEGALLWYGVRFAGRNFGVDLGLMRPICRDCDDLDFVLGFPWVTFTYRGLPGR